MKKIRSLGIIALSLLIMFVFVSPVSAKEDKKQTPRPSQNGTLSVRAANLVDQNGNIVVLKGVSLHGLTWFPDFINEDLFIRISKEWDANLVRLPVYPEAYIEDPETVMALVDRGVKAAIAADMYVIVDWHVMEDPNPNDQMDQGLEFFDVITSKYGSTPNVLYEICNEPNGETTWSDIRNYAYKMIPAIREKSPDSVIFIGTPNYSKNLISASRNSVKADNIMYSLHFYAGTHKDDLRREYDNARTTGLPIFVTECGLSEASGSGTVDYSSAASWFSMLEDNNTSFAVWSLSNKNESSALFKPFYDPSVPFTDDDLSGTGQWVRDLLKGDDPRNIPVPQTGEGLSAISLLVLKILETEDVNVAKAWPRIALIVLGVLIVGILVALQLSIRQHKKFKTYDDLYPDKDKMSKSDLLKFRMRRVALIISAFLTLVYIGWRIMFSVPVKAGPIAITGNLLLLVIEIFGFFESVILYYHLMGMKDHPVPKIEDDEYPDVDIFIASYNEPEELLRKTINGCNHLIYPDKSKVHIWLCDDNRRPHMRKLAEEMNIGYFDRPDNEGAKAGNLNHAMGLTSAPYIVTLDADMIPRSNFLLRTIPYFVDTKKRSEKLPDGQKIRLGLLQTPQCFYTPDVFQYALYSEKNAPNEQDFFYRTIEVAKTVSNSVIYGGSNTVLAREALDEIGGFFTGSITEDFATGMLIEEHGFVSLATPEPLASGMTPSTYKEHIQQRRRWGRGVISTAKQLKLLRQPNLSFVQKLSYMSSVVYWYSPIKNLIYLISPLLFACFAIPVFKCGWLDLVIYWLPMFIMQDAVLRILSGNKVSLKWSGIYETSVMPHLLIPIIKETFGITTTVFEVTDKSKKRAGRKVDTRTMVPFIVLLVLCVFGIIRSIYVLSVIKAAGVLVLLFWLFRNTYFLIMSLFLIDGRDGNTDDVSVVDAESVSIKVDGEDEERFGVTTHMTIHSLKIFMDESEGFRIGEKANVSFMTADGELSMECIITSITYSRFRDSCVLGVELIGSSVVLEEYMQILYDRIPSLPQSLTRDYGIVTHMLRNIAYRILR
ncbi:MAG: cellulase family glycosylhydrolase [Lachnospiraceae bacterium]|nr:cellulase family glycosylhydrolase [Lachnospiraceae bacterium]